VNRRLGLDVGVLTAGTGVGNNLDIDWTGVRLRSGITMTPVTAGLNVHLTPGSRFDVYMGPLVAYVMYSGFSLEIGSYFDQGYSTRSDFGFGANLGVDLRLGKGRWSLNTNIRYLNTTLEFRPSSGFSAKEAIAGSATTDLDPTIFSIGFGVRF
jgi:outer membrane protein W